MGDTQSAQKEIFGKIQGFMAFLDTAEQKKSRENLEEWQDTFESLRDITNNPLPFLLELLKMLKSGINCIVTYSNEKITLLFCILATKKPRNCPIDFCCF